jgi:ORF6N domain
MKNGLVLSEENIAGRIYLIRGLKVMLDFDLATLYGTETRALKQQVKRNQIRFPEDFMFQLTKSEWNELITICDKLSVNMRHLPAPPLAFTEQGVAMLSGVLKSHKAILVNIGIMRTFVQLRKLIYTNKELSVRIDKLEKRYDKKLKLVFTIIREMMEEPVERKSIGFRRQEES